MALFSSKKNTKTEKKTEKKSDTAPASETSNAVSVKMDLSHVIRHARITEKATMHSEQSVYTFNVAENATKRDIMAAVKKLYSVTPRKVRVATIPSKIKRSMRTGRTGVKTGGKKAYVYLKKGETINI
jgi:large subunit ribosomal protein L23